MRNRERSTPQSVALEILAQVPREYRPMVRERADGSFTELDLGRMTETAAQRIGECGTFPRGRVVLRWADGAVMSLGAHQCNHRLCPRCGRRRGLRLASDMAGALQMVEAWGWSADRVRFATLTIENVVDVDEGLTRIMEAWHRTLATKTWGRLIAGGFRAVEVKPGKDGKWNVHLHAILFLWTPGVPYKLLREAWNKAAGGVFNQRFDRLRRKARAAEGESKALAAARYLVKYLVKQEELRGARRMPGGLPHLLGAMEGRRFFGAWGLGAAALRIERRERPAWTGTWDRHLAGYRRPAERPEDELPVAAEIETPWGVRERISIPVPALPAAFRQEDVAEQAQAKGSRWSIRRISVENPLRVHPWQRLPVAMAKNAAGAKAALEEWLENPKARGPKPFRWRSWFQQAPREWTAEAGVILGTRRRSEGLGAILWDRPDHPLDRLPPPDHPEAIPALLVEAHVEGVRAARRYLFGPCKPHDRPAYLARLPESIRQPLEEACLNQALARW